MNTIMNTVPGFNGRYSISRDGAVFSHITTAGKICGSVKAMKTRVDRLGYVAVWLSPGSGIRGKSHLVHKLVMLAFGPTRPGTGHEVNHVNGIKSDNRLENLEWVTRSQNVRHAIANGLLVHAKGSKNVNAKLNERDVSEIRRRINQGETQRSLASEYGVHPTAINSIFLRRSWRHVA